MRKSKIVASLLAASVAATTLLAGCNTTGNENSNSSNSGNSSAGGSSSAGGDTSSNAPEAPKLEYADDTILRMATGYNSASTGLFFDEKTITDNGENGALTLSDGNTYRNGDLKPTWVEVQNRLKVKFENKYQGNSASKEFDYWKEKLGDVDMVSGTATQLTENGAAGKLVDISKYLDSMPNFKAYLEANPIVRLSITGSVSGADKGAIYFSPYFDGVNDIERMPLMRTDWVEKLLNGEGEFKADAYNNTSTPAYQPYMPTSGKVAVDVVKKDGSGVETINKDYDKAGNIVAKMNEKGPMTGVEAVNMLRTYIDEAYDGYYGTNRADLFIGQNAAWDADELVALLRCVVANPQTLNGTSSVQGLHSREDANNQRRVDMFRFAGTLFGVRGLESRQDYLYVGTDNQMHDARQEKECWEAMDKMNAMVKEGLISTAFVNGEDVKTQDYLKDDLGFMHYDYNQTQTLYDDESQGILDTANGEKYMAVMVPVARWNDGTEKYMRFTESWRSVKTDGWGISVEGVGNDTNKLNAALSLIDYAYSQEGQILMSYGPDSFIKTKADGSYETFNFNGEQWPVISDKTREELWSLGKGNYTNYARYFLGSTLSFAKSQAFEYQCTSDVGREGAGYISTAIGLGTIKHPELALAENPWYTSVPTVLPYTTTQKNMINGFTEIGEKGQFSSSKDPNVNLLVDVITKGYTGSAGANAEAVATTISGDWNGAQYLALANTAWKLLVDYYNTLNA